MWFEKNYIKGVGNIEYWIIFIISNSIKLQINGFERKNQLGN